MTSYELTPYPVLSYRQTHPGSIAAVAVLLGLDPAPPESCRVLELGCASGGNLLPMAEGLPGSQFAGIDLSPTQVEYARRAAAATGLDNIEFHCLDVRDAAAAGLGTFDYIIAHGLYSWVPADVRDALLALCAQSLAPDGIAYVSYNTFPGWHMMLAVREMMLYHARQATTPSERAARAREIIDILGEALAQEPGNQIETQLQTLVVAGEKDRLSHCEDSALLHDELEETNHPVYFHEFAAHAARHGLSYLAEAELRSVMLGAFPENVRKLLLRIADSPIALEQYMDFVRNRVFRQSLLCRRDLGPRRELKPERLRSLYLGSPARLLSSEPGDDGRTVQRFGGFGGPAQFATDHPLTQAVMGELIRAWPGMLSFDEAIRAGRATVTARGEQQGAFDEDVVCANLLQAHVYSRTLVEVSANRPALTALPSERPMAGAWARILAMEPGTEKVTITNLRHERVELDALPRAVLGLLDGTRTLDDLVDDLLAEPLPAAALAGTASDAGPGDVRARLREAVADCLRFFGRAALLR